MEVNTKAGQEMTNIGYLNNEELRKMTGQPAQAGGKYDKKPDGALVCQFDTATTQLDGSDEAKRKHEGGS